LSIIKVQFHLFKQTSSPVFVDYHNLILIVDIQAEMCNNNGKEGHKKAPLQGAAALI